MREALEASPVETVFEGAVVGVGVAVASASALEASVVVVSSEGVVSGALCTPRTVAVGVVSAVVSVVVVVVVAAGAVPTVNVVVAESASSNMSSRECVPLESEFM